ncbi:MAG: hypothetical protein GDA49_06765 [Rhodospirillales bacterium]|nr:hypothetical protein [Rhodospirillales bacterium]
MLQKENYRKLPLHQRRAYNFSMVAAKLADYGYDSVPSSPDLRGHDTNFIARHIDGKSCLVRLKTRATIDHKRVGQGLYIAFRDEETDKVYVYPHDEMERRIVKTGEVGDNEAWKGPRSYNWPTPPKWLRGLLQEYEVR